MLLHTVLFVIVLLFETATMFVRLLLLELTIRMPSQMLLHTVLFVIVLLFETATSIIPFSVLKLALLLVMILLLEVSR